MSMLSDPAVFSQARLTRWIKSFISILFDFEFKEIMTVKMLPILYAVAILSIAAATFYLSMHAVHTSSTLGVIFILFIAPIFFIFSVSAVRATLEFFSALFKVQQQMALMNQTMIAMHERLKSMDDTTVGMESHTAIMANTLNEINGVTDKIPFFKKTKKPSRPQNWAEAPLQEHLNNSSSKLDTDA